eukprot:g1700.t1
MQRTLPRFMGGGGGGGHALPQWGGRQEMPPKGGFPTVKYARGVPAARGPSGAALWVGGVIATVVGFYVVGQSNIARREYKKEKRLARAALIPLLQAEEDARYVEARRAEIAKEAELMKSVPGWEAGQSVYHSGKWMPATVVGRS